MPQQDAVLFANEAFYRAFAERAYDAMKDVWAKRLPLTCIHPGWSLLTGRDEVMQSWRAILGNPDSPSVLCLNPSANVYGDSATVVCHERIGETYLIATNIFIREEGRWLLVHHQAGPVVTPPEQEVDEPATMH